MNKKKIFNDPVYGFISIPSELIFDIIEHPYFQRLRRIKQLGLTDYVYPGALHTRFHHAIGAMHLMKITLDNLRDKGNEISDEEYEAALIAILLHDIGHGPFSHALEFSLLKNIQHELLSSLLINELNTQFDGALDLAVKIFNNQYKRTFFNQLVASQLDIDRLDYLKRDSFFTGVSEGTIGAERIIKLLDVRNDQLLVEEKGIYSIENFLNARRLMYWQVYLHKTSVSAERMLISLINRAKYLCEQGVELIGSESLLIFLKSNVSQKDFESQPNYLSHFANLDDFDIWGAIKMWQSHEDKILNTLANCLLKRKLFKVKLSNEEFSNEQKLEIKTKLENELGIAKADIKYFYDEGSISNSAYMSQQRIYILTKKGNIIDIADAADLPNIQALSKIVKKNYICWAKNLTL
ncbi:HD domain-containing protein [Fulvivirgaceae bacterium LMO-SS25]